MFTSLDFKVEIMNPELVKEMIDNQGEFSAICYNSNVKYKSKIGESVLSDGHMSGSRGDYIKFHIEVVPRYCYDEKTEILTNEGWKFFKDIKDDEVVATRNPNTHKVEFNKICEKIAYKYNGKMHKIKSNSVDLVVTENHNIYHKKASVSVDKDKFYITPIQDITYNQIKLNKEFNYENDTNDFVEIKGYTYQKKQNYGPNNSLIKMIDKYTGDLKINKQTFFKFLAWYLSDGNTSYCKLENKYTINITQTNCEKNIKNRTREQIVNLIKEMGFTPVEYKKSIKFNNLTLGKFLKELGTSEQKIIPFNIYDEFNKEYAKIFLNEYFKGDGHIDKNGCGKFYTTSRKLADQLQELCFVAGWTAMVYKRCEELVGTKQHISGREVNINHIGYVVNVSFNNVNREPYIRLNKHREIYDTDEMVYCVNVKNHIIFVRREGKAVWCCNCVDQAVRSEQGVYKNVQSQRYCDMSDIDIYVNSIVANDDYLVDEILEHEQQTAARYLRMKEYMKETYPKMNEEQINDSIRTILPIGQKTKFNIGFDIEGLIHFMNVRLCSRADYPIRMLAMKMKELVLELEPRYAEYLVPKCEAMLFCNEKHGCGKYPSKKELLGVLDKVID